MQDLRIRPAKVLHKILYKVIYKVASIIKQCFERLRNQIRHKTNVKTETNKGFENETEIEEVISTTITCDQGRKSRGGCIPPNKF